VGSRIVIGIGHRDRGDDAVGRIVAARLRAQAPRGIEVLEHDGEAAALVEWLGGAETAVVVDAASSGEPPGTVSRFDVVASALPRGRHGTSTHGIGLAEAIELARILGRLPSRCLVYGVEAQSFEHGAPLSAAVSAAIEDVVRRVLDEFGTAAAGGLPGHA
jgi:hydrogenase maturation protease